MYMHATASDTLVRSGLWRSISHYPPSLTPLLNLLAVPLSPSKSKWVTEYRGRFSFINCRVQNFSTRYQHLQASSSIDPQASAQRSVVIYMPPFSSKDLNCFHLGFCFGACGLISCMAIMHHEVSFQVSGGTLSVFCHSPSSSSGSDIYTCQQIS
jgi:hypothetical protein